MGLDSVELLWALEDRFGIEIPDKDAVTLGTAREVTDYVYSKVSHAPSLKCLTQRAFYRVRCALIGVLGIERRGVVPGTRLDSLLPKPKRRSLWKALAAASDVDGWPPLIRPSSVTIAVTVLPFAIGLALLSVAHAAAVWSILGAFATFVIGLALTRPLQTQVSGRWPTVGGVAEYLAIHHPAALLGRSAGWTREQVRQLVRITVVDELGVPSDFDDNAEFARDLGVD